MESTHRLSPGEITRLLRSGREAPGAEGELWHLVYDELKDLARLVLQGRRRSRGPQTTTLVHEAYLRLLGHDASDWNDRRHFFAIAARAMRFVLVDDARRRLSVKRGAGREGEEVEEDLLAGPAGTAHVRAAEDILAVHQALDRLAEVNPRHVRMVELRYFSGLTVDETADVLGVSRPTVVRDWRAVRTWLHGVLEEGAAL